MFPFVLQTHSKEELLYIYIYIFFKCVFHLKNSGQVNLGSVYQIGCWTAVNRNTWEQDIAEKLLLSLLVYSLN
jgi:hypothetical protein